MPDFLMAWILLAGFPLGLALLCGFGSLYTFIQTVRITGWEWLIWKVLLICAICVFSAVMVGWNIGASKRKKRERMASSPKKE